MRLLHFKGNMSGREDEGSPKQDVDVLEVLSRILRVIHRQLQTAKTGTEVVDVYLLWESTASITPLHVAGSGAN